jgi:hypothetical protein
LSPRLVASERCTTMQSSAPARIISRLRNGSGLVREQILPWSATLDPHAEPLHQFRGSRSPPVAHRHRGDRLRLWPVQLLPFGQPRGHSASLGGISESSLPTWLSRSACGRSWASVGMKRNWTSLKGVLRLYEQRWLVAYSTTHGRRTNQRGSAGASASLTRLVQISRPILSRVR